MRHRYRDRDRDRDRRRNSRPSWRRLDYDDLVARMSGTSAGVTASSAYIQIATTPTGHEPLFRSR